MRHLFLHGFPQVQLDGDEFREHLRQILQSMVSQELGSVLLQVANDFRSSLDLSVDNLCVFLHSETTTSRRLQDVLIIIVVLAGHTDLVQNEVGGIETNSKVSHQANVAASTYGLHENLATKFGDRPDVVRELVLSPSNARILNLDGPFFLSWMVLTKKFG